MPEITDAEYRQFVRYQALGTPEDAEKKIRELEADNKTQRDEIRDLKAAQLTDGAVALPKERADALERYEALGTPDDLATIASERDELRQRQAARERQDAIRAAVEAAGWPADTVATLEDMRSLDGATFEVRTEKNDKGEDVRSAYLTLAGEGQQPQRLADFATSAPQLRGLRTEPGGDRAEPSTPMYPRQRATGETPDPGDPVEAHIQKMREAAARRPSPLMPREVTTT